MEPNLNYTNRDILTLKEKINVKYKQWIDFFEGSFLLMIQKYKLKHTIL